MRKGFLRLPYGFMKALARAGAVGYTDYAAYIMDADCVFEESGNGREEKGDFSG